jgi:hypothetical protein
MYLLIIMEYREKNDLDWPIFVWIEKIALNLELCATACYQHVSRE